MTTRNTPTAARWTKHASSPTERVNRRCPRGFRGLEIVVAAVRDDGYALQYAAAESRADREVALIAVCHNPFALQFVAEGLRADREIVLSALCRIPHAWAIIPERCRADPCILGVFEFFWGDDILAEVGEDMRAGQ